MTFKTDFLKEKVNQFISKETKKKKEKEVVERTNQILIGDMIAIYDYNYSRFIYYIVTSASRKNPVFTNIDWTVSKDIIKFYGSQLKGITLGTNISKEIEQCVSIGEDILKNAELELIDKKTYQYFYVQSCVFDSTKKFPKKNVFGNERTCFV